ncbi:MAG TPA: TonB-dependent receptor [Draconibacterium sp.]|nr:TonB-dependent receptor [Draconibacterium sp.]
MNYRLINLSIALFINLIASQVFSQPFYTVKGNLFNTETSEPISRANIAVVNTTTGTSSDEHGNFELRLANGVYKIGITSVGFTGKEIEIRVPSGNNEVLKIGLQPKKQEIEGVDIFGNFTVPGRDTAINVVPLSILPAITRVSALEIEKQGAVTLTDALKYVPGGWTETRGRKSKQFFSVRGQKYPYPDYSIDGVWQKEFEETAYVLSALDVESVEIVRSSNALVKGLSGLTGVIEVRTIKPKRETISLLTKYGEHNNYVANLQYGNKINDVSFNTAAAFFGTDGIPGRGGKERIANFHSNMDWTLGNKLTLLAGATYISGLREFVHIVEPGSPKILNQEEKFDPLHTWVTYAKLNYRGNDGSQTELQVNYTFRDANYQNFNIRQESTTTHHDKDWEYGFNLLHSRLISASNTFRIGALYNHWVAPDGKRYYAGRRCDVETWSGVVADEQKIGRFLLDAGFRLIGSYINEWGGFGIEGSSAGFQSVAPIIDQAAPLEWQSALGGSYVLSPASSLHYNFSGGTIAPRKGSLNSAGMTPKNETRFQYDFGFRFKTQNQSEITISTFYTQRKNALDLSGETVLSDNDLLVELYENLDKRSYGVEMAANVNIPVLQSSVFANATLMKNEKEADNKMVDDNKLPNVILNGGYLYAHSGVDANLFIHYTGPYSNNRFVNPKWVAENGDYPLGDFVTADFTCGYTFSGKFKTRIFLEVKNILDKKYQTVAGYPDTGRLFQMGVKLNY